VPPRQQRRFAAVSTRRAGGPSSPGVAAGDSSAGEVSRSLSLLVVGGTIVGCGLGMLACAALGAVGDGRAILELALPGALCLGAGTALALAGRRGLRGATFFPPIAGFAAVTLAWVTAAAVGSAPLLLAGAFSSPLDAYFEAMSGFTTTGATLLAEIEPEPEGILAWRSLMQWLGGIGIVVLLVAVAPVAGSGLQRAFYAEASGITHERLTPRIIDTAKIIASIYLGLSLACGIAFAAAGMSAFDALNHALTTIATGGFSPRTASIGAYDSVPIELVAIVFMALAGVNFAFYGAAIRGGPLMPRLAEVRAYFALLAIAIAAVWLSLLVFDNVAAAGDALRQAAFSVTSLMTTTGYVTADFDKWNEFARSALILIMIIGACAGSTAGGIKVVRALLLAKSGWQEAKRQTEPRAVQVLRLGGTAFSEDLRRAVFSFFLVYSLIFVTGVLAFAACDLHPVTAISATAATLNVIGPGLGEIGATESYQAIPDFGRVAAIFLMLAGRLEIFTIIALLAAGVRSLARRRR
jgi:trk system potassium uptake protein